MCRMYTCITHVILHMCRLYICIVLYSLCITCVLHMTYICVNYMYTTLKPILVLHMYHKSNTSKKPQVYDLWKILEREKIVNVTMNGCGLY